MRLRCTKDLNRQAASCQSSGTLNLHSETEDRDASSWCVLAGKHLLRYPCFLFPSRHKDARGKKILSTPSNSIQNHVPPMQAVGVTGRAPCSFPGELARRVWC